MHSKYSYLFLFVFVTVSLVKSAYFDCTECESSLQSCQNKVGSCQSQEQQCQNSVTSLQSQLATCNTNDQQCSDSLDTCQNKEQKLENQLNKCGHDLNVLTGQIADSHKQGQAELETDYSQGFLQCKVCLGTSCYHPDFLFLSGIIGNLNISIVPVMNYTWNATKSSTENWETVDKLATHLKMTEYTSENCAKYPNELCFDCVDLNITIFKINGKVLFKGAEPVVLLSGTKNLEVISLLGYEKISQLDAANSGTNSISLTDTAVTGSVILSETTLSQTIQLNSLQIGGDFKIDGCTFTKSNFEMSSMSIAGSFYANSSKFVGGIGERMFQDTSASAMYFDNAVIHNDGFGAKSFESVKIKENGIHFNNIIFADVNGSIGTSAFANVDVKGGLYMNNITFHDGVGIGALAFSSSAIDELYLRNTRFEGTASIQYKAFFLADITYFDMSHAAFAGSHGGIGESAFSKSTIKDLYFVDSSFGGAAGIGVSAFDNIDAANMFFTNCIFFVGDNSTLSGIQSLAFANATVNKMLDFSGVTFQGCGIQVQVFYAISAATISFKKATFDGAGVRNNTGVGIRAFESASVSGEIIFEMAKFIDQAEIHEYAFQRATATTLSFAYATFTSGSGIGRYVFYLCHITSSLSFIGSVFEGGAGIGDHCFYQMHAGHVSFEHFTITDGGVIGYKAFRSVTVMLMNADGVMSNNGEQAMNFTGAKFLKGARIEKLAFSYLTAYLLVFANVVFEDNVESPSKVPLIGSEAFAQVDVATYVDFSNNSYRGPIIFGEYVIGFGGTPSNSINMYFNNSHFIGQLGASAFQYLFTGSGMLSFANCVFHEGIQDSAFASMRVATLDLSFSTIYGEISPTALTWSHFNNSIIFENGLLSEPLATDSMFEGTITGQLIITNCILFESLSPFIIAEDGCIGNNEVFGGLATQALVLDGTRFVNDTVSVQLNNLVLGPKGTPILSIGENNLPTWNLSIQHSGIQYLDTPFQLLQVLNPLSATYIDFRDNNITHVSDDDFEFKLSKEDAVKPVVYLNLQNNDILTYAENWTLNFEKVSPSSQIYLGDNPSYCYVNATSVTAVCKCHNQTWTGENAGWCSTSKCSIASNQYTNDYYYVQSKGGLCRHEHLDLVDAYEVDQLTIPDGAIICRFCNDFTHNHSAEPMHCEGGRLTNLPTTACSVETVPTLSKTKIGVIAGAGAVFVIMFTVLFVVLKRRADDEKRSKEYAQHEAGLAKQHVLAYKQSWQIPFGDLKIEKLLASGSQGTVYLGSWSQAKVAVKILLQEGFQEFYDQFEREAETMSKLRHPKIITFYGYGEKPGEGKPFIVSEFMAKGSLYDILHDKMVDLDWGLRMKFITDIAGGMEFLHSRPTPILHRDLKSENCLVDENWNCKVADFGCLAEIKQKNGSDAFLAAAGVQSNSVSSSTTSYSSSSARSVTVSQQNSKKQNRNSVSNKRKTVSFTRRASGIFTPRSYQTKVDANADLLVPLVPASNALDHTMTGSNRDAYIDIADQETNIDDPTFRLTSMTGTLPFMAPEVIKGDDYGLKADVYSFGVVIFEIATRREPHRDFIRKPFKLPNYVTEEKGRPKFEQEEIDAMPSKLMPLVSDCWEHQAGDRPSFQSIADRLKDVQV
eukprot:m.24084 g.24084  ORF g.24084 m.24084 type:complete len:1626 (+) comp7576_c0_seq1:71-4948(+)